MRYESLHFFNVMGKPRIMLWMDSLFPYKHTFVIKIVNVAVKNILLMLDVGRLIYDVKSQLLFSTSSSV